MSNVTNASAIGFANEKIRPAADSLCSLYKTAKTVLAFWQAKGMSNYFPADATVNVDDGSLPGGTWPGSPDGRTPITAADVNNVVAQLNAIVTSFEANSNAVLNEMLKVAVNPG